MAHIFFNLLFFPPKKPPENPRGSSELRSAIASGTWQRCVALLRSHQTELQIRFDHGDAQTFSGHWRLGLPWILFFQWWFCGMVVGKLGNLWMPLMYFNLYIYLYKLHTYLVYMHTYKIVKSHDWGDDHPLFEWRKWSSNPCSHEEQWWFPKGTWLKTRVHFQIPCLGVYVIS